ncbi:MAG: hypothetical protein JWN40_4117 [Phycisphaerales bacterium]|nr:hypothetical protein [Phycisphaerales bacterium]
MSFVKVIGLFDDRASLDRARAAVLAAGLATPQSVWVEPDQDRSKNADRTGSHRRIWQRLKQWFAGRPDEQDADAYAEHVRRGGLLLVVETPEEAADQVKQILANNGAVELRRRIRRWALSGPTDPAGFAFAEEEIKEAPICIQVDGNAPPRSDTEDSQPRDIRLYDEASGREIGRISEAELKVLQDALEEEDPDDHDYWINQDEIEDLACRAGATPHLISLLRAAVANKPGGIDIAFEREGQARESLRGQRGATK